MASGLIDRPAPCPAALTVAASPTRLGVGSDAWRLTACGWSASAGQRLGEGPRKDGESAAGG